MDCLPEHAIPLLIEYHCLRFNIKDGEKQTVKKKMIILFYLRVKNPGRV